METLKCFRRYSSQLILGLFFTVFCTSVSAQGTSCPRQVLAKSIQAAVKLGGYIEPVHVADGLAVVVSGPTKKSVRAIHKAIDAYVAERSKPVAASASESCRQIMEAIKTNGLVERAEKTSRGALLVYTSSDTALVKMITSDCCTWCVCKSDGSHGAACRKCCGHP